MTFNINQLAALKAPLSKSHVKERKQAGRALSYVEAWHAIAEANRIFGFHAWTRETVDIRCVAEGSREIGKDNNKRLGHSVSYVARVRVTVNGIVREGTGAGHGIDADLGLAHESAIKEAESDAMKRALMTFGNPFGLALYDKEQANVTEAAEPDTHDESKTAYIALCRGIIRNTVDTFEEKAKWWNSPEQKQHRHDFGLTQQEVTELKNELMALAPQQKEAAE
jgi:DNA repair and recombination protein RAD52